jgi:hypothetical protein
MYSNETVLAKADDGTEIAITIKHVDIDPTMARTIFETGIETGTWGWKHKTWDCPDISTLMAVQAAARFFYGWAEGSEKVTPHADGGYIFEAHYAC